MVSFELEKQKNYKSEQIYVALGRIKSLEGLFLSGYFQRDAVKENGYDTNEYERIYKESLFVSQTMSPISLRTLTFILPNTRFLRKHVTDMTSDSSLTKNVVLILTETQLDDTDNVTNIHHLLNASSIFYNNSNFSFSRLAIAYEVVCKYRVKKGQLGFLY